MSFVVFEFGAFQGQASDSKIGVLFGRKLLFREHLLELHHPVAAVRDEDRNRKRVPHLVAVFAEIKHSDEAQLGLLLIGRRRPVADEGHDGVGSRNAVEGRNFGYDLVSTVFSFLDIKSLVPLVVELSELRAHLLLSLSGVHSLRPGDDLEEWKRSPEMIDSAILHSPRGVLLNSPLDVVLRFPLRRFGQIGIARATTQVEQTAEGLLC